MNDRPKSEKDIEKKSSDPIIFYVGSKKYDVTNFLDKHPGGKNCLIKKNGQDVKEDFEYHSRRAKKQWEEYRVKKESEDDRKRFCIIL
jgi:cytochrome b involved in lipid metabolism